MLPIPSTNYIPKLFKQQDNEAMDALTDKLDELIEAYLEDIINMQYLITADRCPSSLLKYLGNMLAAGVKDQDSDRTKRQKIYNAIQAHKNRSLWDEDAKVKIDAITGYSAAIFRAIDSDDCIEMGQLPSDPDYYWSTEGSPGFGDDNLGTWEVGDFTEYVIAGIIYIDCHEGIHVSTLTAQEIAQIVEELEDDVAPAYYRIYLGYVDTGGAFIKYAGGVID